jgi:hypothetical protein
VRQRARDEAERPDQHAQPVAQVDEGVERVRGDEGERLGARVGREVAVRHPEGERADAAEDQAADRDPLSPVVLHPRHPARSVPAQKDSARANRRGDRPGQAALESF